MKRALVFGVSGQDGGYLSKLLISKEYIVYGVSRDAEDSNFENLRKLNVLDKIKLISATISDSKSVLQVIMKVKPDEIYNLAGQTSVGLSFKEPMETMKSISLGVLNILEAIRFSEFNIKFYNAGSSESFGKNYNVLDENTSFNPRSPYGVAKSTAFWNVAIYREAYNIYACTGILFNHESPFRKEGFVTKKIISTVCRIANGSNEKLALGNINIFRDWGWAPEYVETMWLMLQQDNPDDYVIATGETISLKDFIDIAFKYFDLNMKDHVIIDNNLLRPIEIEKVIANPTKAKLKLNWKAKTKAKSLVERMIDCELNNTFY